MCLDHIGAVARRTKNLCARARRIVTFWSLEPMPKMTLIATDGRSLGQVGYEAYALSTGGKTFDGRLMPKWHELPEGIQRAWNDAANAISDAYTAIPRSDTRTKDEHDDCG
jgi:hypothetical protein